MVRPERDPTAFDHPSKAYSRWHRNTVGPYPYTDLDSVIWKNFVLLYQGKGIQAFCEIKFEFGRFPDETRLVLLELSERINPPVNSYLIRCFTGLEPDEIRILAKEENNDLWKHLKEFRVWKLGRSLDLYQKQNEEQHLNWRHRIGTEDETKILEEFEKDCVPWDNPMRILRAEWAIERGFKLKEE